MPDDAKLNPHSQDRSNQERSSLGPESQASRDAAPTREPWQERDLEALGTRDAGDDLPPGAEHDDPYITWQPPRGVLSKFVAWLIILVFAASVIGLAVVMIITMLRGDGPAPP